jgi:hypothetical protein
MVQPGSESLAPEMCELEPHLLEVWWKGWEGRGEGNGRGKTQLPPSSHPHSVGFVNGGLRHKSQRPKTVEATIARIPPI